MSTNRSRAIDRALDVFVRTTARLLPEVEFENLRFMGSYISFMCWDKAITNEEGKHPMTWCNLAFNFNDPLKAVEEFTITRTKKRISHQIEQLRKVEPEYPHKCHAIGCLEWTEDWYYCEHHANACRDLVR